MELKLNVEQPRRKKLYVLIVPSGIETGEIRAVDERIDVLIVPSGIETVFPDN